MKTCRRTFIKNGITLFTAAVVTPRTIFDLGAISKRPAQLETVRFVPFSEALFDLGEVHLHWKKLIETFGRDVSKGIQENKQEFLESVRAYKRFKEQNYFSEMQVLEHTKSKDPLTRIYGCTGY